MGPWLAAYAVTLAVEGLVVATLWHSLGWLRDLGQRRTLLLVWLANLTHPCLWLVGPRTWGAIAVAEVTVTLVEGLVYGLTVGARPRRWALGLATSVLANAASWALGILLYAARVLPV